MRRSLSVLLPLMALLGLLPVGTVPPAGAQALPWTPTATATRVASTTATARPTVRPSATATASPTARPTATPLPSVTPWPSATAGPSSTPTPTATPLPPGYGRDSCDPNHTLTQPCAVATETDIANLNFTDGAVDVFSVLLKGGRQYRLSATVGTAGGLDPALAVYLAGQTATPLASNDDVVLGNPSAVVTLTVTADAWYLVQVTNQAPGDVAGKTYTFSARSVAGAGTPPEATPAPTDPDDLIGNAYDVAHAVRLAPGVPYDLSLICPDPRPGACYAGRHTFLLLPVKAGVPLVVLTYDLGAGVDTVLTLYAPDPAQASDAPGQVPGWRAVQSNDDVAAGWTLRSQLLLTPSWSGDALLVVAPAERADLPVLPADGRPGRYRLILGSPALPAVAAVLAAQTDLPPTPTLPPSPTLRPTGQAAPADVATATSADPREVIKETCGTGTAVVHTGTSVLYAAAPPGADDQIAAYPTEALIRLLGECYGGWVKVQPLDSVTPGWMWGADLRPDTVLAPTATGGAGASDGGDTSTGGGGAEGADGDGTSTGGDGTAPPRPVGTVPPAAPLPQLTVTAHDPLPLPTADTPRPVARTLTVTVCRMDAAGDACAPVAGVAWQLGVVATAQLLGSAVTDTAGQATLTVSAPPGAQLALQLPALGLATVLDARTTTVPLQLPPAVP